MAKRFVDTSMYSKAWFRKLKPKHKCLWEWLRLHCDHAGVVDLDIDLVSFQIGETLEENDLLVFGNRLENLGNNKFWIVDFVKFQYGELKENYNPHKPVIASLQKHGLFSRVAQPLSKTSLSLVDKDKDKDKDKIGNELFDSVVQCWNDTCANKHQLKFHLGTKPESIKRFVEIVSHNPELKKIENWKICFETVKNSEFLNGSQNPSGFVCTLDWLISSHKIVDVLNGQYGAMRSTQVVTDDNLDEQYKIYLEKKQAEKIARGASNA